MIVFSVGIFLSNDSTSYNTSSSSCKGGITYNLFENFYVSSIYRILVFTQRSQIIRYDFGRIVRKCSSLVNGRSKFEVCNSNFVEIFRLMGFGCFDYYQVSYLYKVHNYQSFYIKSPESPTVF